MRTYTDGELRALVILLGDDNPRTTRLVRECLSSAGERAMPFLAEACHTADPLVRGRARLLFEELRLSGLQHRFEQFAQEAAAGTADLETGIILVAQYEYPELDAGEVVAGLDALAADLRERVPAEAPLEEQVQALCRYLGVEQGFRSGEHYDHENSYLNRVLERRSGTQPLLSAVYVLVGRRLGLPIEGVGLPGHFIVQVSLPGGPVFIDPAGGGRIWSKADCYAYLRGIGLGPAEKYEQYLQPASIRSMIARILVNLVNIYTQVGDERRAQQMHRFLEILTGQE